MLVFPIRPIAPVAKVVRSAKTDQSEETEADQPVDRSRPLRAKPSRRENKSFYESPNERSSSAVQDALLDLQRNG